LKKTMLWIRRNNLVRIQTGNLWYFLGRFLIRIRILRFTPSQQNNWQILSVRTGFNGTSSRLSKHVNDFSGNVYRTCTVVNINELDYFIEKSAKLSDFNVKSQNRIRIRTGSGSDPAKMFQSNGIRIRNTMKNSVKSLLIFLSRVMKILSKILYFIIPT
jgi:hypothetical protein